MLKKILHLIMPVGLTLLAAIARLIPHAPNLAPIAAVALLSGSVYKFPRSFFIPLTAMFISDFFIGFSPWPITLSVYGSFALISLTGNLLRDKKLWKVPFAAISGSLLFYIITNFAVWLTSGMYEQSMNGLIACYVNAIPFFRNTIVGDMTYTMAIFLVAKKYLPVLSARDIIKNTLNLKKYTV